MKKGFLTVFLITGLTLIFPEERGLYFFLPSTSYAQNDSTFEKKFNEFKKSQALEKESKRKHVKNLKLIEAEGIIIRDVMGRPRATLATDHQGVPFLDLYDKDGKILVSLNNKELFIDSSDSKMAIFISPLRVFLRKTEQHSDYIKTKSTSMWAGVPKSIEVLTVCKYNDETRATLGFAIHDLDCLNPADEDKLMVSAKSLYDVAEECLYDVRDRGTKYNNSANCSALSALSKQYGKAGGWQDINSPSEHARIANQARTTAWMARAISAAGDSSINIW